MASFGASIPGKWYKDTSVTALTKSEFIVKLQRALMAVGMVPVRTLCTYPDLEQPAYDAWEPVAGNTQLFQVFDYPTSETFSIAGVNYKPCLILFAGLPSAYDATARPQHVVGIRHGRRKADTVPAWADTWTTFRQHVTGNGYGFIMGLDGTNWTSASNTVANYWGGEMGMYVRKNDWKRSPLDATVNMDKYLGVQNFHVVLNPSGLLVQIGSHPTRKAEVNDYINAGFFFSNTRIPGRGLPDIQDVAVGKVDPVIPIPFRSTDSGDTAAAGGTAYSYVDRTIGSSAHHYSISASLPNFGGWFSWAIGGSFQTKNSANSQRVFLRNLGRYDVTSNEWQAKAAVTPWRSPAVVNGSAFHVLDRVGYFHWNEWSSSSDQNSHTYPAARSDYTDLGVVDAQIPWREWFYFPGFTFSDTYAPPGEYVDPNDSRNWWLFYSQVTTQMHGFDVEGVTKSTTFPTFPVPGGTVVRDSYVDFSTGSFPAAAATTNAFVGTLPDSITAVTDSQVANDSGWKDVGATDEVYVKKTAAWQDVVTLAITCPSVPLSGQRRIKITFDARNRRAAAGQTLRLQYDSDDSILGTGWRDLVTLAGANNAAGPTYDYATYTTYAALPKVNGTLYLRFNQSTSTTTSALTDYWGNVKNVHIEVVE